jgi:type 2 lantibiotic biosynthesis protein LanM
MDATHPDFLRDDLDRARHWNLLWNDVRARSELEKFLDSEMRQIELGDIPYFAIRPESTEAQGADGTKIPDAVSEPGQTAVRRRLSQLSDSSMEEQLWFIRASLGCVDGYARKPKQGSERTTDSLLDAARDAGNEVLRSLIYVGQMASFLNISCVSGEHETQNLKYAIRPADNGLYEGVGGVALFLAYLARESGDAVFEKAAEALLNHVLKTDESGSPVLLSAFSGVCSRLYLFTHLGRLWQRTDLLDRAERLLTELPGPIEGDRSFDIISGTSGALLSLLALSRLRPTSKAKDMAVRCGEHLLQVHEQKRSWESAPFHRGFSHGASGISFALARLAQETGEVRYRKGALDAASYERALLAQGNWTDRHADRGQHQCSWCHGAAGIALARLGLSEIGEKAAIATDLQEALQETARSYRLASQCLCHGTLGNLEPLLLASRMGISSKEGSRAMEGAAARLQDEIRSSGWRSGLPSQTLSNGLFTGLSGIGYGFLRLRNPDTVPSVLTLAGPL